MSKDEVAYLMTDVRYALRQLRQFGDVGRAVDALERLESNLARMGDGEVEVEVVE